MKQLASHISWVIAVGLAIGLAIVSFNLHHMSSALQKASDENARLQKQVAEAAALKLTAEQSAARVKDLEQKLSESETKLSSLQAKNQDADSVDAAAAPDAETKAGEEDSAAEQLKSPFAGMAEMFKGEQGKELAKLGSRMAVDMQYGKFLRELQLSPEMETQVKDIILRGMESQTAAGLSMLSGDQQNMDDIKKAAEAAKNQMRDELSKVLSLEQLQEFDAYQEEMPYQMLDQQMEMQMGMFAPELTAENKVVVKQALLDEYSVWMDKMKDKSSPMEMNSTAVLGQQLEAIERARESLRGQLDEEQFGHVERFLNQQQSQIQMAQQMFQGMQSPQEPKGEKPK